MTTPILIKQATIDDLDHIASLFNEYRIFYNQESDLQGARDFLFDRFEHRESIIFIAVDHDSGEQIGFAQLYPSFSSISMKRSIILNDLFVRESYRKHGIGKMLLDMAKSYATQIKAVGIELETAITNEHAQRIYEKNEYIKNQEYYHYYLKI